ncbi:MAG: tRNA (5-methylaminomethyl-2-thiouridine)(34)-methyltransferase MnmD [Flavobacteriales bacterium]|nr:tRNA (5-methylaminomethyl-2-thiouridine)(34)-methyltransferase MnmD [Flavobacteriales bacterium]
MNKLIVTEDGSHTLFSEQFGEHYHSLHGAIQESRHIFIEAGLKQHRAIDLNILEIGFGTGLNALLSYIEALKSDKAIRYTSLELYPLSIQDIEQINYGDVLGHENEFLELHEASWGKWIEINATFKLHKLKLDILTCELVDKYDLIFFDAFSPEIQPELWTESIFDKIARVCNPGAILTTYSVKGAVRRALQKVGFEVERIPGPPGKREIMRATMLERKTSASKV